MRLEAVSEVGVWAGDERREGRRFGYIEEYEQMCWANESKGRRFSSVYEGLGIKQEKLDTDFQKVVVDYIYK